MARHTPYQRAEPPGAWIARFYCHEGHTTFSLLPDCLASRLSSTLVEVEQVVAAIEDAEDSLEAVAENELRPDIQRQGAVRWTHRRVVAVRAVLVTVAGLLPTLFAGCELSIQGFRAALGVELVLPALRGIVAEHLACLPPPVGFGPRPKPRNRQRALFQQEAGADFQSPEGVPPRPPESPG